MIVYANENNFNEEVKDGIVLVDFYADWCGPCKMLGSVLEELANDYKIVKVNVDENENLAREYGVMSIPYLMYFKDGEIKNKSVGFLPLDNIKDNLDNL